MNEIDPAVVGQQRQIGTPMGPLAAAFEFAPAQAQVRVGGKLGIPPGLDLAAEPPLVHSCIRERAATGC